MVDISTSQLEDGGWRCLSSEKGCGERCKTVHGNPREPPNMLGNSLTLTDISRH
jgi:hypothetical protein